MLLTDELQLYFYFTNKATLKPCQNSIYFYCNALITCNAKQGLNTYK